MKICNYLFFFISFFISKNIYSQDTLKSILNDNNIRIDSTKTIIDSNKTIEDSIFYTWKKTASYNAKKAGMYSALFPGLGQIYNKQYWKLSIVGAGIGLGTYAFIFNKNKYTIYKKAYLYRVDGDPDTIDDFPNASKEYLQSLKNQYRKSLDYTVLFIGLGYFVNIVDAIVYAHLKDFDISPTLSFKTENYLNQSLKNNYTTNIGIKIKL